MHSNRHDVQWLFGPHRRRASKVLRWRTCGRGPRGFAADDVFKCFTDASCVAFHEWRRRRATVPAMLHSRFAPSFAVVVAMLIAGCSRDTSSLDAAAGDGAGRVEMATGEIDMAHTECPFSILQCINGDGNCRVSCSESIAGCNTFELNIYCRDGEWHACGCSDCDCRTQCCAGYDLSLPPPRRDMEQLHDACADGHCD